MLWQYDGGDSRIYAAQALLHEFGGGPAAGAGSASSHRYRSVHAGVVGA
jgi:hypothetical protein